MRRAFAIALLLTVVPLRAETPALLSRAIQKLIADEDHWAYTQTTRRFDQSGRPSGGQMVERYDPSRPIDEQWQLLEFAGHAPSPLELRIWQRDKEKAMKHHGEKTLGDVLDLDHATLDAQTPASATFLVPTTFVW